MANLELTLQQARENSANFLYIFCTTKYVNMLDKKYRVIIMTKRLNQIKLINLSCDKYLGGVNDTNYSRYKEEIRAGFVETYGMQPIDALYKLAAGETIAGKNFSEGAFGIGATNEFKGVQVGDPLVNVTVDPTTGHIFAGSTDITDESKTIRKSIGGKTMDYQLFGGSDGFYEFMSQYSTVHKKYVAKSYKSFVDNKRYTASGLKVGSADAGSIWENITFDLSNFLDWLSSLLKSFGINIPERKEVETINSTNTLPNQLKDGYCQKAGIGEAGTIALLAVAGGALLFGGLKPKKKKK